MANRECIRRLQREYKKITEEPTPGVLAQPNAENMLEWHFILDGPSDTPYQGGKYHGKLKFPEEYPHKPPSIMMITPSGRFIPETRLCLSYSDFHPESWNPMWSVSTILTGLMSFMASSDESVGTLKSSDAIKRIFAKESMNYNLRNPVFLKHFGEQFQTPSSSTSPPAPATDTSPSTGTTSSMDSVSASSSSNSGEILPQGTNSQQQQQQQQQQSGPTAAKASTTKPSMTISTQKQTESEAAKKRRVQRSAYRSVMAFFVLASIVAAMYLNYVL